MSDLVSLDFEDAQAIAQNISENLQYDGDYDREFWQAILERLKVAIEDSAL
tara:strand:- start:71 stop:223 length:153 start_codon:yes stop_codon:yes gene_type:complete